MVVVLGAVRGQILHLQMRLLVTVTFSIAEHIIPRAEILETKATTTTAETLKTKVATTTAILNKAVLSYVYHFRYIRTRNI
jgi:hypothetical protein